MSLRPSLCRHALATLVQQTSPLASATAATVHAAQPPLPFPAAAPAPAPRPRTVVSSGMSDGSILSLLQSGALSPHVLEAQLGDPLRAVHLRRAHLESTLPPAPSLCSHCSGAHLRCHLRCCGCRGRGARARGLRRCSSACSLQQRRARAHALQLRLVALIAQLTQRAQQRGLIQAAAAAAASGSLLAHQRQKLARCRSHQLNGLCLHAGVAGQRLRHGAVHPRQRQRLPAPGAQW
jgi:hypothetical protein